VVNGAFRLQFTVQVLNHDSAALRNTLVAEENNAMHSIGDIRPSTEAVETMLHVP